MTFEFLDAALNFTVSTVFRLKQLFACPRPVEYSPDLQPLIMTPGHDSWPSGHATESFLIARLLALFAELDERRPKAELALQEVAFRIAENREIAGVHFRADSAVGRVLGDTLARFVWWYSADETEVSSGMCPRHFRSAEIYPSNNLVRELPPVSEATAFATAVADGTNWPARDDEDQSPKQPYMSWLWQEARKEWL